MSIANMMGESARKEKNKFSSCKKSFLNTTCLKPFGWWWRNLQAACDIWYTHDCMCSFEANVFWRGRCASCDSLPSWPLTAFRALPSQNENDLLVWETQIVLLYEFCDCPNITSILTESLCGVKHLCPLYQNFH